MSARYFLDTNILVYSFDSSAQRKQDIARRLIRNALKEQIGCISSQVVQEFLNVSSRKFNPPLTHQDSLRYLNTVLAPLCNVFTSLDLQRKTLEIAARWQYSLYDSMIITAALEAGCTIIYSEDLQAAQQIERLKIVNPFIQ